MRARAPAGAVFALGAGATLLSCLALAPVRADERERSASELMDVLMWNREPVGGPFALIDHTGKPRTEADFRGKLLLIYFGFTYCPDVCPTDLQAIGLALDQLGAAGEEVQPLFITVDPERDTPQLLADYVPLFHPRYGRIERRRQRDPASRARIQSLLRQGCDRRRSDYTVDHSGYIYLMDRAGQYLGFFPPGTPPDRMADVMRPLIGTAQQP